jgi:signal transduction histidine kinase
MGISIMTPKDNNITPEHSSLILIVDDVPENVSLLGTILRQCGYKISIAETGNQAIKSVKMSSPDLILLDVMMPDVDGLEVCRRLKGDHTTRDIPIIFLTAKVQIEDKIEGLKLGGSDYITKPFNPTEVVARVKTHLNLKIANDTIKKYNDELEILLEARTKELIRSERQAAFAQFIQGIMHNLKNPLAAVKGFNDLIEIKRAKTERHVSSVSDRGSELSNLFKSMKEDLQSVNEILNDLVLMIDSMMVKSLNDKSIEVKLVDLNDVIRRELKFLKTDQVFKNIIKKHIQLSVKPLNIEVVPGEISQVIQNVLHNAIEAVHDKIDGAITVQSGAEDEIVYFEVMDNGPGIPEENLTRIFDPFFTTKSFVNSDNRFRSSGIGLGLYMCSEIMKSYGGKIRAESVPNTQTTFIVSLPIKGLADHVGADEEHS